MEDRGGLYVCVLYACKGDVVLDSIILLGIVCYENEEEVCQFLRKLSEQKYCEKLAISITVNKASNKQIIEQFIKEIDLKCYLFEPGKNLGYLNGCIFGIRECSKFMRFQWGIICNTDITFSNDEFFSMLYKANYEENIWGIAPSIKLLDGGYQNPYIETCPTYTSFRIRKKIFSNVVSFTMYSLGSVIKKDIFKNTHKTEKLEKSKLIYAPHGSFMIFRKPLFDILCTEKNDIFLYCEEEYIAGLVKENGKTIIFDPNLKVIHNEHQTLGKINYSNKQRWYIQSMKFLDTRFYGRNI